MRARRRARHPGGAAVLEAHAGTDATAAFRRIGHHRSPAVAALYNRYRVGVLDSSQRSELYSVWTRTLYLLAEMENALRIDYGALPVDGERGLFARRHRIEAHQRFRHTYLGLLVDQIPDRLWQAMLGATTATPDVDWLRRRIADIQRSADFLDASRAADDLTGDLAAMAAADPTAAVALKQRLDIRCQALERVNIAFTAAAKHTVRIGVLLMERQAGTAAVVSSLRRLPAAAAHYCQRVAAASQ